MAEERDFRIWRGDARGGDFESYRVVAEEGMVVLDAIHAIQAADANDLAVRWNCKAGRCGSCSAEVNGRPGLMCMTRVSSLPAGAISVAPLRAFPVIRDLVADVSANYEKAARIVPFVPSEEARESFKMHEEDVERLREFHNCIECFLCQDVCHVLRDHPEHADAYAGPRLFVRIAALEMHPLDAGDRVQVAQRAGIAACNVTKCCTEVCPEGIRITDNAIIPMKERVADRRHDPLAKMLGLFSAARGRNEE